MITGGQFSVVIRKHGLETIESCPRPPPPGFGCRQYFYWQPSTRFAAGTRLLVTIMTMALGVAIFNTGFNMKIDQGRRLSGGQEPEVLTNQKAMEKYNHPAVGGRVKLKLAGRRWISQWLASSGNWIRRRSRVSASAASPRYARSSLTLLHMSHTRPNGAA